MFTLAKAWWANYTSSRRQRTLVKQQASDVLLGRAQTGTMTLITNPMGARLTYFIHVYMLIK